MEDNLLEELLKKRDDLDRDIEALRGENNIQLETLYDINKRVQQKPKVPKYMTGVKWLDDEIGGFAPGTYINLAGQSFSGKTHLALNILANIAEYKRVVLFSFEMYEDKLAKRTKHLKDIQQQNIFVSQSNYKLTEVESIIRSQASKGVLFFVIDSRMKITVQDGEKEYQKISYMSNKLSKLCQELGIIVLLINQTSEEDLKHGRFSLKGSGDQFYDSDIVLFLAIMEKDDEEQRWCFCKKDRDGERLWDKCIEDKHYSVEVKVYDDRLDMAKI